MYRLVFVISLIFLIAPGTVAQEGRGVSWYDKATYDAYLKGDWNGVIKTGKEALKQGIDFYYLRMRLGIAFFSKKDYHKAIPQFRGALRFNPAEPVVLEYLYWCYLYTGREEDRQALIQSLPLRLREKLNIKKTEGLRSFELSFNWFQNPGSSGIVYDPPYLPGTEGYQTVTRHGGEGAFRFRQAVGKAVSLEYGYHFLGKNRLYFYRDYSADVLYPDNAYRQHQFYGSIRVHPLRGFTVGFSANYLNLRTQISTGSGHGNFLITETSRNWTTRFSLQGDFPFFSLYGGTGIAGLNGLRQLQTDLNLITYPAGNLNFYAGAGVTWMMQGQTLQSLEKGNIVYTPLLGFQIAKPLWAELSGTIGNLYNYQGGNEWIIYNEMNPVKNSAGLNLIFEIFKANITVNLLSTWSRATSYYYQKGEAVSDTYPIHYDMLSFTAGIKWTFY